MTLEGDKGIYDFALPGLIEIVGYKEGDAIAFKYVGAEPTSPVEEIIGNTKTNIGEKAAEENHEAGRGYGRRQGRRGKENA